MEHGLKELNKLLNIFDRMSVGKYLELYNKSLSLENIEIVDIFIKTDLSYASNQKTNNFNLFDDEYSDIILEKDEDDILTFRSDREKAA